METFEDKVMVTYKEKVGAYQRVFSGEDGKIVLNFTILDWSPFICSKFK
jgi:hypothetical protein